MWTCYHTPVYANQETFLSWYSKPSAHFLNYSIFSPQVFSIFKMKNHICTLFDNLSLIPSQSLMRQIVKVILILHCHSQNSKKSWGIPIILTFWFTHIFHTTSIFCKKNKTNRTPSPQPPELMLLINWDEEAYLDREQQILQHQSLASGSQNPSYDGIDEQLHSFSS